MIEFRNTAGFYLSTFKKEQLSERILQFDVRLCEGRIWIDKIIGNTTGYSKDNRRVQHSFETFKALVDFFNTTYGESNLCVFEALGERTVESHKIHYARVKALREKRLNENY